MVRLLHWARRGVAQWRRTQRGGDEPGELQPRHLALMPQLIVSSAPRLPLPEWIDVQDWEHMGEVWEELLPSAALCNRIRPIPGEGWPAWPRLL